MATKSKSLIRPIAGAVYAATRPMPLDSYVPGDALPLPEVIEKNSDSVWALWSAAVKEKTDNDLDTQPATLLMGLPDAPKDPGA